MISFYELNLSSVLLVSVFGVISYEICWIAYCRLFHPLRNIPGPFLASFSRLWIYQAVHSGRMERIQSDLHKRHGPFIRIAPNEVACSLPEAIPEIYRNQNPLEKTDFYTTWHSKEFGKYPDLFSNVDEKSHSARRRIVNNVYSLSNVLQSETYIDKCSQLFLKKLGEFADSGKAIDLGEWLQMYAFDVIGELYFGSMFGFVEKGIDYENYISSLDTLNPILAGVAVSPTYARPFILISAIVNSSVRHALKAIAHVTQAAKSCVMKRQQELTAVNDGGEPPRKDLLNQLFEIMREKGEKVDFNMSEIEYEAYVGLFAGSDTTAIAMRSVFYNLSRNPDAMAKLRKELDEALPFSEYPIDKPIKYADAIKLPYLCATIKEATRLHPSVGFTLPRISPSPDGLSISGVHIPAGYRVGVNGHIVQKDRNVFGADADQFRPDRWLESNNSKEKLREMDKTILTFGAGTRTCIGKNISLSELHKLIPQIIRTFELERVDSEKDWETHNFWFIKQTGMLFQLKRRQP